MVSMTESEMTDENVDEYFVAAARSTPIAAFFRYGHLPEGRLRTTSKRVALLARELMVNLPSNAEMTAGLRKLLEAKDCFVRAAL